MQSEARVMTQETSRSKGDMEPAETPQVEIGRGPSLRKRGASATLEHSPTKVAKSSDGSERSREGSVATVRTIESGSAGKGDGEETVEELKRWLEKRDEELKFVKEKANMFIRDRKAEITELKTRNTELETNLARSEIDFEVLKKSRGHGNSRELTKQLTDNLNKKNDKKISELKAKHQKAIEMLKEKVEDAEQEAKDAKAEFVQKEKDMKKNLVELKKDLKAEQAAEIKKFKAENSSEVKEKRDLVKMFEKKIQAHEQANKQSGEEIGELQHEISRLSQLKRVVHAKIREYDEVIRKKDDFTASIGQEYAAKTADLEQKLAYETKRWAKQKENTDDLMQKLVAQQKTNLILRNANDGKVEKLRKVMAEMKRLRGLDSMGGAPEQGTDASTQSEAVGDEATEMEKRMDGVEGEAGEPGLPTDGTTAAQAKACADRGYAMRMLIGSLPASDAVPKPSTVAKKADSLKVTGTLTPDNDGPAEGTKASIPDQGAASGIVAFVEKMDSPMKQFTTPEQDICAAFTMDSDGGANASKRELDQAAGPDSTMADGAKAGEASIFESADIRGGGTSEGAMEKYGSGMSHAAVNAAIAAAGGHLSGLQDAKVDGEVA